MGTGGERNLSLDESPGSPTDRTFSRGEGQPDRVGDAGRDRKGPDELTESIRIIFRTT